MNRQSYNQMGTPAFNQQNDKNAENKRKINKSMLKLHPTSSFKSSISSKIVEDIHPSTVANKYRCFKFKTQENSPVNQRINSINYIRFPELQMSGNTLSKRQHLLKQSEGYIQRDVAKTAIILDSLIKYLKDQSDPRNNFHKQKRMINLTQQSNEFFQCSKTKRCKKPKIVKNQITKKFFQGDTQKKRKIQSEDRCRKINNSIINEKISEYTFYGGNFHQLKIQAQCPISNKDELNEVRINKLSKRRFDFN